jgi:hypothetical protein
MWHGWPNEMMRAHHNPESTITTSKRNFAADPADWERKLASNITSTSTDHVNTRWSDVKRNGLHL